jgi:hypothetical protein
LYTESNLDLRHGSRVKTRRVLARTLIIPHIDLLNMAAEQQPGMELSIGPFSALEMRITQGGKIRTWVEFALKFFEVCTSPVIVMLH